MTPEHIFNIRSVEEFNAIALKLFRHQAEMVAPYRTFIEHLKVDPASVKFIEEIPFLPLSFFKTHQILEDGQGIQQTFSSSGTTGQQTSQHHISDLSWYERSFRLGFQRFYGNPEEWCILALLPSYLERKGSSLIYMAQDLIQASRHPQSGFYLDDLEKLSATLEKLEASGQKTLLLGVSFALLDLAEQFPTPLSHCTIMETGGMKGRRKELVREELHTILCRAFQVDKIHSEYGMTELLSQAYSNGDGRFFTPPWTKVLIREANDPFSLSPTGRTGGINIIDLANRHSCAFLATQDLGRYYADGSFEVLGRFDHSDLRGCNLMVAW